MSLLSKVDETVITRGGESIIFAMGPFGNSSRIVLWLSCASTIIF